MQTATLTQRGAREILTPDYLQQLVTSAGLRFGEEVFVHVWPHSLEIKTNPARALWGALHHDGNTSHKDAVQLKVETYEGMGDLLDAKISA